MRRLPPNICPMAALLSHLRLRRYGPGRQLQGPLRAGGLCHPCGANRLAPGTDCIIELGGEDAKILFLTNGTEVRMNGSCAGGTGAFIDQMATLLKMARRDGQARRPRPAPTPSPAAAAFLPKATSSPSSTRAHRRATSRRRSISRCQPDHCRSGTGPPHQGQHPVSRGR